MWLGPYISMSRLQLEGDTRCGWDHTFQCLGCSLREILGVVGTIHFNIWGAA